jgi:hypothetical protein
MLHTGVNIPSHTNCWPVSYQVEVEVQVQQHLADYPFRKHSFPSVHIQPNTRSHVRLVVAVTEWSSVSTVLFLLPVEWIYSPTTGSSLCKVLILRISHESMNLTAV